MKVEVVMQPQAKNTRNSKKLEDPKNNFFLCVLKNIGLLSA